MSREVSDTLREAAFAQETGEVVVHLLTLTHESLAEPIRLSSDPTRRISDDPLLYATTSRGDDFLFLPFAIVLPQDRDDVAPRITLQLDNVERSLIGLVRSIATPLSVQVEIVLGDSPDFVEAEWPVMKMASITYNQQSITAQLVVDGLETEPFPSGQMSAGKFPGLF